MTQRPTESGAGACDPDFLAVMDSHGGWRAGGFLEHKAERSGSKSCAGHLCSSDDRFVDRAT